VEEVIAAAYERAPCFTRALEPPRFRLPPAEKLVLESRPNRPYTMGQLTEGLSKFLVVTLPGAFTPT